MKEIQTETKDNGSWSQYIEVGVHTTDRFGDVIFQRKGYARKFPGLTTHTKTEGRGAAKRTRYLIDVPDDFPYVIRRVTNPGGSDPRRYDILYQPEEALS